MCKWYQTHIPSVSYLKHVENSMIDGKIPSKFYGKFSDFHDEIPVAKISLPLKSDLLVVFWLVVDLPLWKIWVSWDDEIPNIWEKNMFQTTNQLFNRSWIVRPPFVMVKFQGSLRSLAWNVSRPAPWRVDTAQPRTSTCSRPLGRRCRQFQSWGD